MNRASASQGGFYTFTYYADSTAIDSAMFDFQTFATPAEDITFPFGSSWATEDNSTQGIASVEINKNFGQFYPNPATGETHINIDLTAGESYKVAIVDITGRTVYNGQLPMMDGQIVYTVNAHRLATGTYHVVFSSKNGQVTRRLIVK